MPARGDVNDPQWGQKPSSRHIWRTASAITRFEARARRQTPPAPDV